MSDSPALRRSLGSGSAVLITVGAIIGSGIFAVPHDVATHVGRPWVILALWVAGGILALLGAISMMELGAAIPETGGLFVHLQRAYGPVVAFAFGWAMVAVLVPSSMGFFAQVTAQYLVTLVHGPGHDAEQLPVAITMIVTLAAINLLGVGAGAGVQNLATIAKYVGVLAIAGLAVWAHGEAPLPANAPPVVGLPDSVAGYAAALIPVLWAYDGWVELASVAGEVKDPGRAIPRALFFGTVLVTIAYLLANVGYLHVLGPRGLAASRTPAMDAAAHVLGPRGRVVVSVVVTISTFGGCAVSLLTGSRVVYSLAATGGFLDVFARTSRRQVPYLAVFACAGMAVVFIASSLQKLGDMFVIGAWPFYALGALATIVLRRKEPELVRPVKTWGYPWTLMAFAAGSLFIVGASAVDSPTNILRSLEIIAAGLPVYFAKREWLRRRARPA